MRSISELVGSRVTRAMVYKYKGDDGLLVEYSHGRQDWYRVCTRDYICIDNYSYWEEV